MQADKYVYVNIRGTTKVAQIISTGGYYEIETIPDHRRLTVRASDLKMIEQPLLIEFLNYIIINKHESPTELDVSIRSKFQYFINILENRKNLMH